MLQLGKNAMDALRKLEALGKRKQLGIIDAERNGVVMDGTMYYHYKDGMVMLVDGDGNTDCFSLRLVRELAEALKEVKYD